MTETDQPDALDRLAALARTGTAGTGALIALPVGGPTGSIVAAMSIQAALEIGGSLFIRLGERQRRNAVVPLAYASLQRDQPMDEISEVLASDPDLASVTTTVLRGAASTDRADKLHAFGRVLTNVLEDRAKVDEEQFIAAAIAELEAPHIRMLGHLVDRQTASGRSTNQFSLNDVELGVTFNAIMNAVERVGLIERQSTIETRNGPPARYPIPGQPPSTMQINVPHWVVTELGQLVMQRLRDAAEVATQSEGDSASG